MAHLYFLVFFTATCSFVSGQSLTYGLKGLDINLKPGITAHPDEILWKHNGNKVVEFNGKQQEVYGRYENRVTLNWASAELNIADLRYEDNGLYELETNTENVLNRKTYKLEVLDALAKPTIVCQRNANGKPIAHGNQATLNCSVESGQPQSLKYEWISHGIVRPGQNLIINLSDDIEEYSCRVSNPLTNATATFTAKDCNTDESQMKVALIVASVSILVLMLAIIIVIIIYCKLKHKAAAVTRGGKGDEDADQLKEPDSAENGTEPEPTLTFSELIAHFESGNDSGKKLQRGARQGSNMEKNEEVAALLHRTPTVPSDQQLVKQNKILRRSTNKNPNDPDLNLTEDKNKYPEHNEGAVKTLVNQIEGNSEPERNANHVRKTKSPSAKGVSPPVPMPCTSSSRRPDRNLGTNGTSGECQKSADSDQLPGKTTEEITETGSSDFEQNGPDYHSDEKQSTTIPQKASETGVHEQDPTIPQEAMDVKEESDQMSEPVSEDESKPEMEQETNKTNNLSSASQHTPSSTKPDNSNTDGFQQSAVDCEPEQEKKGKIRHDSHECEGSSTAMADRSEDESETDENIDQSSSEEEEPGNENEK